MKKHLTDEKINEQVDEIGEQPVEPKLETSAPWKLLIFCGIVLALMIACIVVIFTI